MNFIEPIGSAVPQVPRDSKAFPTSFMGSKIALTCPAQGSPIPSFRLDFLLMIFV